MRRRSGFTLIELMIVIVIIILLIALLVPAVGAAMRNAREGQVRQEIGQLEYAIADFNAHFGMNPPSYIDFRLYDGVGPSAALDPAGDYLRPATTTFLRRLWPNINLVATDSNSFIGFLKANPASQRELNGSACLVFFLGGMVPAAGEVPVGFSNNPRSPLMVPTGSSKIGPFFEFRKDRLFDADPTTFNGYEGYLDTLPDQKAPYWYVRNDRYATQETANATASAANMRPVYKASAGSFFNAQKFQIVSPGPDGTTGENNNAPGGAYGIGGEFDPEKGTIVDALPATHAAKGKALGDNDNITNFHGGRLIP